MPRIRHPFIIIMAYELLRHRWGNPLVLHQCSLAIIPRRHDARPKSTFDSLQEYVRTTSQDDEIIFQGRLIHNGAHDIEIYELPVPEKAVYQTGLPLIHLLQFVSDITIRLRGIRKSIVIQKGPSQFFSDFLPNSITTASKLSRDRQNTHFSALQTKSGDHLKGGMNHALSSLHIISLQPSHTTLLFMCEQVLSCSKPSKCGEYKHPSDLFRQSFATRSLEFFQL